MTDALALAAGLTPAQAGKLAHALGWPARRGRTSWTEPFRNWYFTTADDPEWRLSLGQGLAKRGGLREGGGKDEIWRVTELGQRVIRLYLTAYEAAYPKDWRHRFAMRAEGLQP